MADRNYVALKKTFQRRKQLEHDLEHVTQEMYRRNLELAETNKTLSLLRRIDTFVLDSHEGLTGLCQQISTAIATSNDYPLVAIFARSSPAASHLRLTSYASATEAKPPDAELSSKIQLAVQEKWLGGQERSKYVEMHDFSDRKIAYHLNITEAELHKLYFSIPLSGVYIVKLTARQKLVGLMVVGFHGASKELISKHTPLIDRLSEAVGVAVDNTLLYEENQRVLDRLQKTNEKLKEMDETKDEFISMASHQLRTPLTSVKGYLSMVLEEDAGKLNPMQQKLLNQAFVSSQRMVYLIADLLNVSRLKTGKFIIDAAATDLSEVVEGEIAQLKEVAKNKQINLSYTKPKNFPEIMLDETKIRQVIMNFADNAIYYTPTGGHIDIELKSDKDSIYFMVKDNGLGVPLEEQTHLFGKFYRASNARKARPDGTGLGLFMAKKVISAQGGHILFESKPGQGSTFGFKFDIKKHLLPSAAS